MTAAAVTMRGAARVALALAALLASACGSSPAGASPAGAAPPEATSAATWTGGTGLAPAEVGEYRGQGLSPRSSLPDNSIAGPQPVDLESYRLGVTGLVERTLSLTVAEVKAFPAAEKPITLHCVEGWSATMLWSGTLLSGLLDAAGADPAADTLLFVCLDGYETTMEISWARERDIILAWSTNGLPLEAWNGAPFQVAAEDKWGYKWAKWVREIRVLREPGYRGFWESRGYSLEGSYGERYSEPSTVVEPPGLR